jgi:hypothetical protein
MTQPLRFSASAARHIAAMTVNPTNNPENTASQARGASRLIDTAWLERLLHCQSQWQWRYLVSTDRLQSEIQVKALFGFNEYSLLRFNSHAHGLLKRLSWLMPQ